MTSTNKNIAISVLIGFLLMLSWHWLSATVTAPEKLISDSSGFSYNLNYKGQNNTILSKFLVSGESDLQDVKVSGDKVIISNSNREKAIVEFSGLSGLSCELAASELLCQGFVSTSGQDTSVSVSALENEIKIESLGTTVVRAARSAPFPANKLFQLFFVLLAAAPIIWLCHKSKSVSQWAITALSISILFWLQAAFTVPLLILVFAYYYFGTSYRKSKSKTTAKIFGWIILTVILLLIIKNYKALFFLPFESYGALTLVLPIGTSYFLIRLLDLQLRWHREQLEDLSFREYLTYVLFPPTIVAGPIEVIEDFRKNRFNTITLDDISYGIMRISFGVVKKLLIVDFLLSVMLFQSGLWDTVIQDPASAGSLIILFCALSYLYAYLDFSAYSDIAIGLSRLYGYKILENFNLPIIAKSLNDFWKRWHISLSGWCFRNIFFPVLVLTKSTTLALMMTFFAVGLWHGLVPTWVTWGLYHGLGLSAVAYLGKKVKIWKKFPKAISVLGTNLFVIMGFAFVSVADYSLAWQIFVEGWISVFKLPLEIVARLF